VANSAFTITYASVPAAECTKIIAAAAGNFYVAKVGTKTVKAAGGSLDVAATTTACNSGGNNNSLVLTSL
uniref:type 4 pilus major pilin n=1 Tax=Phytobacter sp. V91 TaxID=3369425 RepID=UPI003F5D7B3F